MKVILRLFGDERQNRRRKELRKIARRSMRNGRRGSFDRLPISTFMIAEANKKAERLERILDLA